MFFYLQQGFGIDINMACAINTTGVTVVVTKLTEDIEGATVEVKDSKGNVVEVEAVDLSAGETTIDFAFATEVKEEDLTGVWTVDGVEFNLGLALLLEKFAETDSQIELYEVLEELGIENLSSANIAAYLNEKQDLLDDLAAEDKELTKEAIQAFVNDVNESVLTDEEKEAAAQAVVKAVGNNIKLKDALNNSAFKYVNNDWLEGNNGYAAELKLADFDVEVVTSDDVQDVINTVNSAKIVAEYNKLDGDLTEVDKEKLTKVKSLIETYAEVNEEGNFVNTTFKTNVEKINKQIAVADVLAATTASKFKSTVSTLANLVDDKNILDMADYVDANGKAYIDYIKEENKETVTIKTVEAIETAIDTVNKQVVADNAINLFTALEKAIENLENKETTTTKAKFVKALQDLGLKQVSSDTDNVDAYIAEIEDIKNASQTVTDSENDGAGADADKSDEAVDVIQGIIDQANIDIVKAADKDGIIAALEVIGTKNVVESNAAEYATATNATDSKTAIQTAIDTVNTEAAIKAAVAAINKAETASEVKTELDVLSNNELIPAYLNVTSADRIFIAEKVLEERDELKADRVSDAKAKQYVDADEVAGKVGQAITKRTQALAAVNALTNTLESTDPVVTELTGSVTNTEETVEVTPAQTSITKVTANFADPGIDVENVTATVKYDNQEIGTATIEKITSGSTSTEITLAEAHNVVTSSYDANLVTVDLTHGESDSIPVNTTTPTTTSIAKVEETQVKGFEVEVTGTEAVTGATLNVYNASEEVVATKSVDLTSGSNNLTVELDSNLADGVYTADVTYESAPATGNTLSDIANALLLVGHDSLSKDTPAANTVVAEKFFNALTFDDNGNVKPKFQSISSIRTVLDGLQ